RSDLPRERPFLLGRAPRDQRRHQREPRRRQRADQGDEEGGGHAAPRSRAVPRDGGVRAVRERSRRGHARAARARPSPHGAPQAGPVRAAARREADRDRVRGHAGLHGQAAGRIPADLRAGALPVHRREASRDLDGDPREARAHRRDPHEPREGAHRVRQALRRLDRGRQRRRQGVAPLANLKTIRKRIATVKSTQKITRAMKMVAAARLNRAQQRILSLRPYAVKTGEVLAEVTAPRGDGAETTEVEHPLLARRPEKNVLLIVITSDRGLCGAFNSNTRRLAERTWREPERAGPGVKFAVIGRKGRDFLRRRNAPIFHVSDKVWDKLDLEQARTIARTVLKPFVRGEV